MSREIKEMFTGDKEHIYVFLDNVEIAQKFFLDADEQGFCSKEKTDNLRKFMPVYSLDKEGIHNAKWFAIAAVLTRGSTETTPVIDYRAFISGDEDFYYHGKK